MQRSTVPPPTPDISNGNIIDAKCRPFKVWIWGQWNRQIYSCKFYLWNLNFGVWKDIPVSTWGNFSEHLSESRAPSSALHFSFYLVLSSFYSVHSGWETIRPDSWPWRWDAWLTSSSNTPSFDKLDIQKCTFYYSKKLIHVNHGIFR